MSQRIMLPNGAKFNRYTILSYHGISKSNKVQYLCRCDCGNERIVVGANLPNGHIKSCGCWKRDFARERLALPGRRKVNGERSPEYITWLNIKIRCTKKNSPNYKWYGGRGIKVCERWMHSFDNFLADMGPKQDPKLTIDRIDNSKGYEPGNCKWSTMKEQCANRRDRWRHE